MSSVLWIEVVLGVLLLFAFYYVFVGYLVYQKKRKEWASICEDAKQLGELMNAEHKKLREIAQSLNQVSHFKPIDVNWVKVMNELAKQVPTLLTKEHVRENFYPEFDPATMSVAGLSFTQYREAPADAKNAIMTIVYGVKPFSANPKVPCPFMKIYANDGRLLQEAEFLNQVFCGSQIDLIQLAFSDLTRS